MLKSLWECSERYTIIITSQNSINQFCLASFILQISVSVLRILWAEFGLNDYCFHMHKMNFNDYKLDILFAALICILYTSNYKHEDLFLLNIYIYIPTIYNKLRGIHGNVCWKHNYFTVFLLQRLWLSNTHIHYSFWWWTPPTVAWLTALQN